MASEPSRAPLVRALPNLVPTPLASPAQGSGKSWRACAFALLLVALVAPPAHALRITTWNLLQYPQNILATRQPNFRTVLGSFSTDMLVVQELDAAEGRDSLLNNVLNVLEPGEWAASGWVTLFSGGSGEGGAIFYKPAKVSISNVSALVTGGPREVMVCLVRPVGYAANSASFRLYSIHLKAGNPSTTPSDSTTRRTECESLRKSLNAAPAGTNLLLLGDSNFYGDWEGGYIWLTQSMPGATGNNGRLKDPLTMPGTWNTNSSYRFYDTQCSCLTGCLANFAGGGLDDRFDIGLTSYSMQDGAGLDLVAGGETPYGNDGLHFNDDINGGGFNNAVGLTVANALHDASDHLPVILTLQVPAKVLADSQLDFGRVITGAAATQTLSVSNPAIAPADVLDYSLAAPAGFTAPAGGFTASTGTAANVHSIGMITDTPGTLTGALAIASDDPDSASKSVLLSGKVLRHAVASLDSQSVATATLLEFGDHAVGAFTDGAVRVFDQGWDALEARLAVSGATVTGGDARFSIVGGFSPTTLAGVGQTWNAHFDDGGATLDSTYEAMLTFASGDEALPGASSAPDLVVTLRARAVSGPAGVRPSLPTALRFYPPRPNPLSGSTTFAFDLPRGAPASLEVFDLSGRQVANLASGVIAAGHHELRWSAAPDRGGPLPAGLYFARFGTPGLTRTTRLVLLP